MYLKILSAAVVICTVRVNYSCICVQELCLKCLLSLYWNETERKHPCQLLTFRIFPGVCLFEDIYLFNFIYGRMFYRITLCIVTELQTLAYSPNTSFKLKLEKLSENIDSNINYRLMQ